MKLSNKTQQAIRVANGAFDILSQIDGVIDETIDFNKKVRNQRIAENVDFLMDSAASHFKHDGVFGPNTYCDCPIEKDATIDPFGYHYFSGITNLSKNDIDAMQYMIDMFGNTHRSVFKNMSYSTSAIVNAYRNYWAANPNKEIMSLTYITSTVVGQSILCTAQKE